MQGREQRIAASSAASASPPDVSAEAASGDFTHGGGVPVVRRQLVARSALVQRLMTSDEPVVTVVAPPGYGKTTLLAQWARRERSRLAWVSCEWEDNDPATLWGDILTALERNGPANEPARALLASSGGGVSVVPRLVDLVSALNPPTTIVLDHLEAVTNLDCTASIAELAVRVPPGWRLAMASRKPVPVPVSRLRVEGRALEFETRHLAMEATEAAQLLRQAGADVSPGETQQLVERTEGWPAGLYLAALAIRSGAPAATAFSFGGDDRIVDDYLRSEVLARVSPEQSSFLVRTSILDRVSGPLCDAVVGGHRSAQMLEELERRNLFVIALDRRGQWYRYHHLLRDLLQAEFRRTAPDLLAEMHSRASVWYERNGLPESAVEHAHAAGDTERVALLVLDHMQPVWARGQVDTVRRWMELLDQRRRVPQSAAIAAHGALIFALLGRVTETERLVAVAEASPTEGTLPDGSTVEATLAYMRAILCRTGPAAMRSDSLSALKGLSPTSPYRATMLHTEAVALFLEGDLELADAVFTRACDVAAAFGATPLEAMVLAERALIAAEREEWSSVEHLVKEAVAIVDTNHLDAYWTSALVFAVAARSAVRRGEMREARQLVHRAARLRPLLTYALPTVSVQALVELGWTYLALVDPQGALTVLEQARGILRRRPDLGTLPAAADALDSRLAQITVASAFGASSLTTAELRLLPLLSTHLSLPEIAERLFVSPHTVKSQVKSVYRKLGVSSRGAAVARMSEIGIAP